MYHLFVHCLFPLPRHALRAVVAAPATVNRKCSALALAWAAVPLGLVATAPAAVLADELDTLQFRVGHSVQTDSNVFRLSDSADAQALIGRADRSDTINITTLGFKLDKSYSLQRFEVDVFADRYDYKNFSSLNFTSMNYAAAWRWAFTPRLRGNITADRREYVDNAADQQNLGRVNRRTDRTQLADAEYEVGGAWRLLGGVFMRSTDNSFGDTFESDQEINGTEVGVGYVSSSNNSVAYRFRNGDGEYPGRVQSAQFATDFRDREHEVRAVWAPTGKTTVRARMSHLERTNEGLGARDFSGFKGQVDATLNATAKTALVAGYIRELENYQNTSASYYEGNRFFVAPVWKATEKISVRARYDRGWRDFRGALPGFAASNRKDTLSLASLSVDYQVLRALKLRAYVQRDRRDSNTAGADYRSNSVGLSALASF